MMPYEFPRDEIQRMPTHFGASPGPRGRRDGAPHDTSGTTTIGVWVRVSTDPDVVARHLPEGFAPAASADLAVEVKQLANVSWLAGRGYHVVTVSTAATWHGGDAPVDGRFQLVLWENAADPIITGREELGFSKLYAEIPAIEGDLAGAMRAGAEWDGFRFLDVEVAALRTARDDSPEHRPPGGPGFHWKHIPRTGAWGSADVSYPVMTPVTRARRIVECHIGRGSFAFHHGTWEQLPTLVNVVDGLAAFPLGDVAGAGHYRAVGSTTLGEQIALTSMEVAR